MNESKPKVLLLANTFWNLHNFRTGIIKSLLNSGYEVITVAPNDKYCNILQCNGCQTETVSIDPKGINPIADCWTFIQFLCVLIRERPNVCLFYTAKPNIYGSWAASILGCAYINNISGLGSAFIQGGWLKKLLIFFYKLALVKSSRVFFQNKDDLDLFLSASLIKSEQSGVLPGSGVDLSRFKPQSESGNSNADFSFILIARMLKDKGVNEYIQAASIVHKAFNGVQFKLLGPLGVDNPSAISQSDMNKWQRTGYIEYLGSSEDVRSFISESTCVVLPSYREGAPKTLLEAAAMGKPIITTDVPGCRDVVQDGVTGLLCEAKSSEDLARKMIKMIQLSDIERKQMGIFGRRLMEQRFDETLVISKYLEEIKRIVK